METKDSCGECGAPIPLDGSCRDHFHALLALEWQIPGGPGAVAHFLAVAAYGLQHPIALNYTVDTLKGLRAAVAELLSGRARLEELRPLIKEAAETAGRVTRREGDPEPPPQPEQWKTTILDVLPSMSDQAAYYERVTQWAQSTLDQLEATQD